MKILVFLLIIANAPALPPFEEAREVLGSRETNRREALTKEIWRAGRGAIPLLTMLAEEENPEIFRRALFVLQRLRMGLEPDSPAELLKLSEAVNQAAPEFRATKLAELLDDPQGVRVALVFLDGWATDPQMPPEQIFKLAEVVTRAVLERRSSWKIFLSADLSSRCRGALVAALSWEDHPMKRQMIANLASKRTKDVFEMSVTCPDQITTEAHLAMARIATVHGDVPLALQILAAGLHKDSSHDLARAIAFLEVGSGLPPIQYTGNWRHELNLFRARARRDFEKTRQLASKPDLRPILAYESNLISGSLTLPSAEEGVDFPASTALAALHQSFSEPPGEPDIEALTSSVLIDWSELARTLMSLACPSEAAEKLSSESQLITATSLLWRTNLREKALSLGGGVLDGPADSLQTRMRLTLASFHFEEGDREKAREFFKEVITTGIQQDSRLRSALKLGLNFFSREELLPLASGLMSDQAYQRAPSIAGLLPYHPKVSTYWYEYFREKDPVQSPIVIFKQVDDFLSNQHEEAQSIIGEQLAASTDLSLPTDVLYQQALFLRVPGALEMIKTAAWYQLSIDDLFLIARDNSWGLEARKQALATALSIDPSNVGLHWLNMELNHVNLPVDLHLPTLGDPGLALQLVAFTGKFETIELSSELADLRDHRGVRCLTVLGQAYIKNGQPKKAARVLQAAICGEVATGPQPATPIQLSLDNLAKYFGARKLISSSFAEEEIWVERLVRIGRN
ncbi:MAG: hypothetical protein P8M04_12230 [Akkermansiaceae bacterium]|nr:hypothetical protein [Akkermansiaceae bacterium]